MEVTANEVRLPALSAPASGTSVAISAAAATATTASEATTATATIGFWTGLVHVDGAYSELRAIECRDCLLSIFVTGHFNETKTTGATSVAIGQNADPVYLAVTLEHLP